VEHNYLRDTSKGMSTMVEAVAPPAPDPGATSPVTEVATSFVALMRTFTRTKARFVAVAEHDVEWSAQMLLRHLANEGPMRASAIAESLQSDPSTVSRQVAGLVKDGLLERRADPEDGRASILVLTPRADAVLAEHEHLRNRHFATMLAGWSQADLHRFASLLRRFTDDFDQSSNSLISERSATRRSSAEGKH
jgi:DNA-binding MarR family transcriptional regulator